VHPVLFEIPLPRVTVPLGVSSLLLAIVGAVVAGFGRRARARDLIALGAAMSAACLVAAFGLRGKEATLGPLPIYGFGVMLCAGLFAGWFLCLAHAERDGLAREASAATYVAAAACGLLGARVLYVLTNYRAFASVGEALAFRSGGLVFYGGVAGGFAGALVYAVRHRLDFLAWADAAAPSLALGSMLGRIGCYFAGCDYGRPLGPGASRFLVKLGTFPRWPDDVAGPGAGSPAWVDQVLYRGLLYDRATAMPVHPTELYESVASGIVLLLLVVMREHKQFRGQVFLAFVTLYGGLRFALETLRDDPERGAYGPAFPPGALAALGFAALACAFAAGPARSIADPRSRTVAYALALASPLVAYLAMPSQGKPLPLSTSQWIAIGSSAAAAVAWRKLTRRASFTASTASS
jgi:phosphatidylglycerol:prolipoprotein diacylglycerol transferase